MAMDLVQHINQDEGVQFYVEIEWEFHNSFCLTSSFLFLAEYLVCLQLGDICYEIPIWNSQRWCLEKIDFNLF